MFLLSCRDSPGGKTAGARKTPSWAQSTQVQIIAKEKEDVKIFLSLFHKYFSVILCVFTGNETCFFRSGQTAEIAGGGQAITGAKVL